MGIGVIESIASADEMTKAAFNPAPKNGGMRFATEKQVEWIRREASDVSGFDSADDIDNWVEEHLTLRPEKIPVFKVKDAVDKIKAIGESAKQKPVYFNLLDGRTVNMEDVPY